MNKHEIAEFANRHRTGFCRVPRNLWNRTVLSAPPKFMVPSSVDCRDYLTPTEDQGDSPMCAAYSAAQWAEAVLWQKQGWYDDIDPKPIYEYAKLHDDIPDEQGTTLTAALESLRGKWFDESDTKVKVIRPSRLAVKFALHQHGVILGGFNISEEWYEKDRENPIIGDPSSPLVGGHAVVCCGYDKKHLYLCNSWGANWGEYGHARMSWDVFDSQAIYFATISGCFNGMVD